MILLHYKNEPPQTTVSTREASEMLQNVGLFLLFSLVSNAQLLTIPMATITPVLDFISTIVLFGVFQSLVLLFLFLQKKPKGFVFITILMGSVILQQIESFLLSSGYIIYAPWMMNVSVPFSLLMGPAVYHYLNDVSKKKETFKGYWHYLPFLFYFGYSFFYFLQPIERKLYGYYQLVAPDAPLPRPQQPFDTDPLNIQGLVVVELISLHLLGYGIASFLKLRSHSTAIGKSGLFSWSLFLTILISLTGLILLLSEGGVVQGYRFYFPVLPPYAARVFGTISLYFLSAFLIRKSNFFGYGQQKYAKTSLTPDLRKAKLSKIVRALTAQKLYLSPSFSLKEFAQKVNMSPNHITEVINEELGQNFFELTNSYRIQEAKKILTEDENDQKMEQLAYSLGYKSKSTFFHAFKKETNLTPAQFKRATKSRTV